MKQPTSLPMAAHRQRRETYMKTIGPKAVAVVGAATVKTRNGDVSYPFRQASDFFYLTGYGEPEAALILRPGASCEREVLFVRPRDPEREVWDGRRAGVEGARATFAADAAYPIDELDERLPELLANADDLYYSLGLDPEFDARLIRSLAALRARERQGRRAPRRIIDPREVLHEMRLRKSPGEIELLRTAEEITARAHRAAMEAAAPGVTEYELQALIDYTFRRNGGSGPGYPTIVGSGENATILHYVANNRTLAAGDLVLIDAGCEFQYYTADVTRTFPVGGVFSPPQRRCYEVVLRAQTEGIALARPGSTLEAIHQRCVEVLTEGMVELGLLPGPAADRVADASYKRFFMHRTSHWLGMDVHDVGSYQTEGASRVLEAGMVITVEPGLYVPADAQDVPAELCGLGIRIEDDILIGELGPDNLSSAVPKQVDEVEAACRG